MLIPYIITLIHFCKLPIRLSPTEILINSFLFVLPRHLYNGHCLFEQTRKLISSRCSRELVETDEFLDISPNDCNRFL